MRISDWSSDVCSSDLEAAACRLVAAGAEGGIGVDQQVDGAGRRRLRHVRAADAKAPGGDRRQGALTLRHPVGIRQPLEAVARQCVDAGDLAGDLDQAPYLRVVGRSEEHTSELQSLMRISYAVFRLK